MRNIVCSYGPQHIKLVKEWAADVWNAYAIYHDLAKDWIKLAIKK